MTSALLLAVLGALLWVGEAIAADLERAKRDAHRLARSSWTDPLF